MITKEENKLEIERNKITPKEKKEDESGRPQYMSQLELTEEQETRIVKEIFLEFDEIKKERTEDQLESKLQELQNQYDGEVNENSEMQFNLHRPTTKIKVDFVTRSIIQAFYGSDPIFSISPRPEFMRQGGSEVCDKQEDFLDYKLDTIIPFRSPLNLVTHSATLFGTGILKLYHEIEREDRQREEEYEGNPTLIKDQNGQPVIDPNTGKPMMDNPVLKDFLLKYPEAPKDYPHYVEKLMTGKKISIKVKYKETTYNDPMPKYVDLKNFYVRRSVEGYKGLKSTMLIVERENYNWWELKREEKKGNFKDIDELMYKNIEDKDKGKKVKNHENESYDILRCTYYFRLKEDDDEETKVIVWIGEERKKVIGCIYWPYDGVESEYIPFSVKQKKTGFYQPGIGEDLTDLNIAEDAILNFTLEGAWSRNLITPITPEDSRADIQFLNKQFAHGLPINAQPGQFDFLQAHMPQQDTMSLLTLQQQLQQIADDVTGVSTAYATGKADPIDPSAPASKTIALMERSGINVREYIMNMTPAFNECAYIILQLYYQMSKEGQQFKVNPERLSQEVTGSNPFATLQRHEMIARTNIQAQAYVFDFNKMNEKKEDVAFYSMFRQEPLIAQNPQAVWFLLRTMGKRWSYKWRNEIDKILPSLDQLQQQKLNTAMQAVGAFVQQTVQQANVTGIPPQFDPMALLASVDQAVSEIVTPPSKEIVDARKKAQGG